MITLTPKDLETTILESKWGELTYICKGPLQTTFRDGYPRQEAKLIVFSFDRFMCDIGTEMSRMELSDEDKEYVARKISHDLNDPQFTDCWIHEAPKMNPPWPTYDKMHANAIAGMASQIGMIEEALTYEQRRPEGPRESVIAKLNEMKVKDEVAEDELAAV